VTQSDEERVEQPLRPRGRHAAPAAPASPLGARIAAVVGPTLAFAAARLEAFRAGPVLPWISRHRLVLLIGGASLVSLLALGGAVALIQGTSSITVAETVQPGDSRPQPGADSTVDPEPATGVRTPTATPTPTPTTTPTPAPSAPPAGGTLDPGGTTTTLEPAPPPPPAPAEGEPRDTAPGATNRPDKPKG
jgi:hypothetical protein